MRFIATALLQLKWKPPRPPPATGLAVFLYTGAAMDENVKRCTVIQEGAAKILLDSTNSVFYNKAQVNSRDMSIAVLRAYVMKRKEEHAAQSGDQLKFKSVMLKGSLKNHIKNGSFNLDKDGISSMDRDMDAKQCQDEDSSLSAAQKGEEEFKELRVLEAFAASGLRALRYACEVDGIGQVIALDNDRASVEACKKNFEINGFSACSKVEAHRSDARVYMITHPKEFDVVDLDPYGSPSIFLDSAVQSVADGGLLMCTATDMAVLCGNDGDVCYSRYGSYPLKGKYCHEMALRILLACIESHANRYKRFIVPLLSMHMDFYIRVFVRIFTSASEMKKVPLKLSYVYQCTGCDSFHLQSLGRSICKDNSVRHAPGFGPAVSEMCSACGNKFNMGGPIWSDPIHDQEWLVSILKGVKSMEEKYPAYEKICAVLTSISEELLDTPLYLSLHNLSATLKCLSPSATMFRSAIINSGYRISGSHANPLALKTNAPMSVIWDIMRCWVKKHPVKDHLPDHPGSAILVKEPTLQANFAQAMGGPKKTPKKVTLFPLKPENWGAKKRAGRKITSNHDSLFSKQTVR